MIYYSIIFHAIDPKKHAVIYEDRTLTVTTIPLRHSVPTCGFFFEEKPRRIHQETGAKPFQYAYCSDTGYKPAICKWIQGADVLYHESTYTEEFHDRAEKYLHSTAREAAMTARDANVGKLLLGHFSKRFLDEKPLLDEARAVFPNSFLAKEGLVMDV